MKRLTFWVVSGLLGTACNALDPGVTAGQAEAALGEPSSGFPNWNERVIHVWTNRARCDPQADLASCTQCAERACYAPVPPVHWDYNLNRAARFHSAHLTQAGCFTHNSPCTLFADISSRYDPGTVCPNAAVNCSCANAVSCNPPDAAYNTSWSARISAFGTSPSAENIAGDFGGPVATFYAWLWEGTTDTTCHWDHDNGHRANILGGSSLLGVGYASIYTQDFGRGSVPYGVVSGVHHPESGTSLEFRANWYHTAAPLTAYVSIDGICYPMALERGSATNGTYLATVNPAPSTCGHYIFHFTDATGASIYYPSSGRFGINCGFDWESASPATCAPCTPSCGTSVCGDNGCGGTCGSCGNGESCVGGACTCTGTTCNSACVDTDTSHAHCGGCDQPCAANETCVGGHCLCVPTCTGKRCGSDGCGGVCGYCPWDQTCNGFNQCDCTWGTLCGTVCVDTQRDDNNCATCSHPCQGNRVCMDSSCVRNCTVDCAGRQCGDDNCNGSCGSCGSGQLCNAIGQCVTADASVPDAARPDLGLSDLARPDAGQPLDAARPDTAGTDSARPDTAATDMARPDAAGTDTTGTDTAIASDVNGAGDTTGRDTSVVAADAAADAGLVRDAAQRPRVEPEGCACRAPAAAAGSPLAALAALYWFVVRRRRPR